MSLVTDPQPLGLRFLYKRAGMLTARHLETSNMLFTDGHVKAIKLETLYKPVSATNPTRFTVQSD